METESGIGILGSGLSLTPRIRPGVPEPIHTTYAMLPLAFIAILAPVGWSPEGPSTIKNGSSKSAFTSVGVSARVVSKGTVKVIAPNSLAFRKAPASERANIIPPRITGRRMRRNLVKLRPSRTP